MGMEVAGSDISNGEAKVETSMPNLHEKENGKVQNEAITFGSNGQDESAKLEAENVAKNNVPNNAADVWPAEPQIHSFYLVRYRTFDDPILKGKIEQADKEIGKRNQQRSQILDGLKAKRSDRSQVIAQLKSLGVENKAFSQVLDEKINQMKPLKEALGSLRGPNNNNGGREKGAGLCSSEAELNDVIRSLNYRMQHEVIPLTEEKQILREIKQLEGTRDKVIANSAMRAKIQESMGQKDAIQDQVKLIGTDLDEVKKDRLAVRSKIKVLEDELKAVDNDITVLQQELASVSEKRDKAFETMHQLRKLRDEGNACFYQGRSAVNNAKELAAKKNIQALEEFASAEVEKFMSSWNSGKKFRDDYEKRILASLDMRQLSRDGRMRNPNEKPILFVEQAKPAEAAPQTKSAPKVVKEEVKPPKEQEIVKTAQKESKKKQMPEPQAAEEEEEYFVVEKPKNEKVIDPAKLKEIKKQEEAEKQKAALERKKKLSDKAAAKAAIRAQKEAEKKQKEREKKMKKKGAATLPSSQDEATENEAETAEAEVAAEENDETPAKATKETNVSTKIRSRGGPTKRRDNALPKAILKRKKAQNYWLYAAPAAAAALAVLLALVYKFAL